jgi:hypothetical protein
MAREVWGDDSDKPWSESVLIHLKSFEALVRADECAGCAEQYLGIMRNAIKEAVQAEREACAKVCDVLAVHPEYASDITKLAAAAIRARGETK